ncbi:MAG: N-acetyltransferase family protein [Alphaproteobacteria bacterium]
MTADLLIRDSVDADVPALREIYAHAVLHGLASFEEVPPDDAEMARRRQAVLDGGYPHLVATRDGEVVGYAYASSYRPRVAYRFTVENSVYVRPDLGRQGIGRTLLAALIERCEAGPWRRMIAIIGGSDHEASIRLHEQAGFERIGTLPGVGFKFDRWVDSVMLHRPLGPGDTTPP